MSSAVDLPEVAWEHISTFLSAPDVLSLLSTHRSLYSIGLNPSFWDLLTRREGAERQLLSETPGDESRSPPAARAKRRFLRAAYCQSLPSVHWSAVRSHPKDPTAPSAREGHVSCVMGDKVVVTGGFTEDAAIYVRDLQHFKNGEWERIVPEGHPGFSYGSSLTALEENRAVLFGGFRSGGYANETDRVAILTLLRNAEDGILNGSWEIKTVLPSCATLFPEQIQNWQVNCARAYHSATLLSNRYLFICGGMQTRGSILNPLLLDTSTWTWIDSHSITTGTSPSPRFGHSVILDEARSRLVLFGGGNGSDLLRSGRDNSEVWELRMSTWRRGLIESLPWNWRLLHKNRHEKFEDEDDNAENRDDDINMAAINEESANTLRPSEILVLGRCHISHRISRDTVLLAFGSGRPSTNGILAFDLMTNTFFRPAVSGSLPQRRFTLTSMFLPAQACIVVHGGFGPRHASSSVDMRILDLAPALKNKNFGFTLDPHGRSYLPVKDADMMVERSSQASSISGLLTMLNGLEPGARRIAAGQLLSQMQDNGRSNGRGAALLSMIVEGTARFAMDEEEDNSAEDAT
jgi:hypothetical protein